MFDIDSVIFSCQIYISPLICLRSHMPSLRIQNASCLLTMPRGIQIPDPLVRGLAGLKVFAIEGNLSQVLEGEKTGTKASGEENCAHCKHRPKNKRQIYSHGHLVLLRSAAILDGQRPSQRRSSGAFSPLLRGLQIHPKFQRVKESMGPNRADSL